MSDCVARDALKSTGTDAMLARHLEGKVNNRKLFKSPVMTSVYGVTRFSARKVIERSLLDLRVLPNEPHLVPRAADYLTRLTFQCLGDIFYSARRIQRWLGEVAQEIVLSVPPENVPRLSHDSSERQHPVIPRTFVSWTTPLGFQITQPYQKHSAFREQIRTGRSLYGHVV